MASLARSLLARPRTLASGAFGSCQKISFCSASGFLDVMRLAEESRLKTAKAAFVERRQASVEERNHHYNRGLRGLDGPNALGVHLPYEAHVKYRRGSRGTWGFSRRGAGRLRYGLKKLADA
eukprot:TRINITY_DN112608_c0_g1_i1.p1 TRINITY_DN112608_c0_g1~~TRINITY_DN112608_c0_g1_i1.p1  ORF type:complete len:131 (-),score=18.80 TRINITY_DN112608_c0_g1_i1:56-421(-)